MTNMTHISQAAAASRESARESTGQFGEQQHSAPETTLASAARFLGVAGPETTIINIADGSGYEKFTPAEARRQLNLPDSEDETTIIALARLLADSASELRAAGNDYPIFASQEPTYSDPGDDADIDTSEWFAPAEGVVWDDSAPAWRGDGEKDELFVMPHAVIDPARHGYTSDQSEAAQNIVGHVGYHQAEFDVDCAAEEDGKIRLRVNVPAFTSDEFEPSIVERRSAEAFAQANPAATLDRIKATGIIFDNDTLAASFKVENPRAVAFAASHGRAPSDVEIAAIVREFRVGSTLGEGFLDTSKRQFAPNTSHLSDIETTTVATALNVWFEARKEAV